MHIEYWAWRRLPIISIFPITNCFKSSKINLNSVAANTYQKCITKSTNLSVTFLSRDSYKDTAWKCFTWSHMSYWTSGYSNKICLQQLHQAPCPFTTTYHGHTNLYYTHRGLSILHACKPISRIIINSKMSSCIKIVIYGYLQKLEIWLFAVCTRIIIIMDIYEC